MRPVSFFNGLCLVKILTPCHFKEYFNISCKLMTSLGEIFKYFLDHEIDVGFSHSFSFAKIKAFYNFKLTPRSSSGIAEVY